MVTLKPKPRAYKKKKNLLLSMLSLECKQYFSLQKNLLLTTYNIVQKFAIICISETYLDSTADGKTI